MRKHQIFPLAVFCSILCVFGQLSVQADDDVFSLHFYGENPWRFSHDLSSPRAKTPDLEYDDQTGALKWNLQFPQGGTAARLISTDREAWGRAVGVSADVYLPEGAPVDLTAQIALRHDVWGWFVAKPTQQLQPGKLNRLYWPLDASSSIWESLGGSIVWNNTMRRNLSRVALRCFGETEWSGPLEWSALRLEGVNRALAPLQAVDVHTVTANPRQGDRVELAFDLTRAYDNPYDPDQITVDVEFHVDGKDQSTIMPAFYFQNYARGRLKNGHETLEPVGQAHWRVRYTPQEAGTHSYTIRISDKHGDSWESTSQDFDVAPGKFKGYIRVDPEDKRWLSFTSGQFFYPVGLIVRSPDDERELYEYEFDTPEGWGTYAYDLYFESMARAGLNFTRIWMSAWWVAIEWSHGYDKSYPGTGRYNQRNAWRLDYIVDLARKKGIYIDLTLHNHGQFRASNFDQEWYDNPYYRGRGGPVDEPTEFWTDAEARKLMRRRLRYIVARWGASPSIAWWELCNEVNLISDYDSKSISRWHDEMAKYINAIDPYRNMTTAHFTAGLFDPSVIGLPSMAVSQSTAYRGDMVERGMELFRQHAVFRKPVYINEFGVGKSYPLLESNLHAGLWSSTVMPFSGSALFWWWTWVEGAEQYYQFTNIVRFQEGEDYRNEDMALIVPRVLSSTRRANPASPRAVGMQNERKARIWIYDPAIYRVEGREPAPPVKRNIKADTVVLDYLEAGRYRVEYWDTWEGRVFKTDERKHSGGTFKLNTPVFERDIAVKLDKIQ